MGCGMSTRPVTSHGSSARVPRYFASSMPKFATNLSLYSMRARRRLRPWASIIAIYLPVYGMRVDSIGPKVRNDKKLVKWTPGGWLYGIDAPSIDALAG